ncbi:MAG: regulatory protein GemA [Eubacteriales bacterium]|nr:regulatory protein GemA [Eubacteriales bacterium]
MTITKEQISKLYGLAARAGLVESGNKDDTFHQIVSGITGKESVKKLTEAEYKKVRSRLLQELEHKNASGRISSGQIKKAWSLMYQIIEHSPSEQGKTAGERMVGAIKKILDIDADVKNPFAWVSAEQGNKLIEMLKRYLRTEKEKQVKGA